MILLAWEGYKEDREELERIMYGAQGIKLGPLPLRDEEWLVPIEGPSLASKFRAILNAHDKEFRGRRAARRAAGAKRPDKATVPPK